MHVLTEAANWLWLQQRVEVSALAKHLSISRGVALQLLQRLQQQGVVTQTARGWQVGPMPQHFFQKKGRSLVRTLTIYERPIAGSKVVGVIEPQLPFLTHTQQGEWWLVCNHLGRIGYIHVEASRLVQME